MKNFDIAVIGGGPAGYVAAIKAAQLGKTVLCIEKRHTLGGTCLNVGCIPSKALLHTSHQYLIAKEHFHDYGIEFTDLKLSLKAMMARKEKIILDLNKGIKGLFKKNSITHIDGIASFLNNKQLHIQKADGSHEEITANEIIIATGSEPMTLQGISIDEKNIVSSTGALSLQTVPKQMIVLGGGVIGLEIASIWSRLGSKVTIIEYAEKILANCDNDISKEIQKLLEKQGINFMLKTAAVGAAVKDGIVDLSIRKADGEYDNVTADILLVAVGRKPFTDGLNLEKIGVKTDEKNRIITDKCYRTSVKNIYAIGDVIQGAMLAHKASEEGFAVAEIIAGQHGHVNYDNIPSVIYTFPEVAWVGKSEAQLQAEGIDYKIGKFPFLANSRAKTTGETDGFVKILVCKQSDMILGAHIIAANAGDLIAEICLGIEFKAASEDIARTSHSHPSYSEAVKEAALSAFDLPLHI